LNLIRKYFPDLTPTQIRQFDQLEPLYREWNEKINVVSRKDIEQLYERHVLHSLGIAKVLAFKPFTEVLDVGTGGGFPGIPLAIMFPEAQFHLVDSIGKKIKVVQEVIQALELPNATAEQIRAEQVGGKYDFIVNRAVTNMAELHGWVRHKINKPYQHDLRNGILSLKGGDLAEELKAANVKHRIFPLSDFFEEEFFTTKQVIHVPV
jgi:16S rRNA (guanine527-N7)-methyltransferase